jgi:hypothetical protein
MPAAMLRAAAFGRVPGDGAFGGSGLGAGAAIGDRPACKALGAGASPADEPAAAAGKPTASIDIEPNNATVLNTLFIE